MVLFSPTAKEIQSFWFHYFPSAWQKRQKNFVKRGWNGNSNDFVQHLSLDAFPNSVQLPLTYPFMFKGLIVTNSRAVEPILWILVFFCDAIKEIPYKISRPRFKILAQTADSVLNYHNNAWFYYRHLDDRLLTTLGASYFKNLTQVEYL